MGYDIRTGIQHKKVNIKKVIVAVVASAGMTAGLAVPALAAGAGDGSNASACGAVHGAFADTNGNFGWLGEAGGAAGYHGVTGQTPGATGYNNSHTNCQG